MIDIKKAMKKERLMRALTGLGIKQIKELAKGFEKNLEITFREERGVNINLGRKFVLESAEEKLFYILFYMKCYPTCDLAGIIFDVDGSSCCRWTHWFRKVLEMTLKKELVLPEKSINKFDELIKRFPEVNEIYIDGTERTIRRPADAKKQKENYSGKKKKHTKKNLLITTSKKQILYVSRTVEGKKHDYAIFKEEGIGEKIPKELPVNVDTGFEGIKKDYPMIRANMPKKKPKGGELSAEEKENNKEISKKRVIIENAIAGVKRLRIVTDPFRNHKEGFDDNAMFLSCGIWNYHLKTA